MVAARPPAFGLHSAPGLLAALLAAAINVFYVALIHSQEPAGPDWFLVAFLAGALALAALALAVGAITLRKQLRVTLLGVGAIICWSWAILAIFSIGLLMLVPAVLGTVALLLAMAELPRQHRLATGGIVWLLTVGALGAGLYLTMPVSGTIQINRPPRGHLQGSATTNGTTTWYRCDDSHLTMLP